jgi:lysozyme family protein
MLYPYGFLLFLLIVLNVIIYNKPSVVNIMMGKIKNFLDHKLLVSVLLLKVCGVSHNALDYNNLLPVDKSGSQKKLFYYALSWHLRHEGLIANHPLDPGGFTYAGISHSAHASWEGWKYVSSGKPVPESMIISFYDSLVWKTMKCDSLPPAIAFYLFDTACLMGTPWAIYLLQSTLNVTADGIMGPQTIQAIRNHDPKSLLSKLHTARIAFHNKIVKKHPNLNVFYNGWIRRANLTYQQASELCNL